MSSYAYALDSWSYSQEADRRFWRINLYFGLPLILLALALPYLNLAGLQSGGGDTLETRYVTLQPEAEPAAQAEEAKPEAEDAPKAEEKKADKPQPTAEQKQQAARTVAQNSGVLAMSQQLNALRESATLEGFEANRPLASDMLSAKAGTGATGGSSQQAAQAFAESAAQDSGGITSPTGTSDKRRTQSGTGLDSRKTTVVKSPIGFGEDKAKPGESGNKLATGRSREEIQQIFDRNKGALSVILNRALRDNPNLRGKITINFIIQPDGTLTGLKLVSSELGDAEVEKKLLSRIQLINFGAKAVPPFVVESYPLVLL